MYYNCKAGLTMYTWRKITAISCLALFI